MTVAGKRKWIEWAGAAVLLVLAGPAAAAPLPVAPGTAVSPTARAEKQGFGAMMLVTADKEGFRRNWYGAWPPKLSATTQAYRGKPVHAMIVFSGCKVAANGKCDVSARFAVLAPRAQGYREVPGGRIWAGAPAARGRMLLGDGNLTFRLDPGEPVGAYRFRALVTDQIAGVTVVVEQGVTAQEAS